MNRRIVSGTAVMALAFVVFPEPASHPTGLSFAISFSAERSSTPLDGRLLLLISDNSDAEPRFQIGDGANTQLIFGIDIEGLAPGEEAVIDGTVFGYPLSSLDELPPGEYYVQALLNRYQTFHRSDGHTVSLPPDRGEGQHWNRKPGNIYSVPSPAIRAGDAPREILHILMTEEIPPIAAPEDTEYIRHERIQSEMLSEFWGTPMYLGANVLLPEGFDEHPEARYPLVIMHGHFPYTFSGFRTEPPDPDLEPTYSARFDMDGYNRIVQEHNYQFFQDWTGPDFPRVILITVQHPTPYYDDSYAVNSENNGPYGDAIMHELVPYLENKYRGIGEGWARFTYGGSTGGWEAMAVQVLYPEEFNGAWVACPDPIDFRAYTVVNLYEDDNAYYIDSRWKRTPRSGRRDGQGIVTATLQQMNHREMVLGSNGRSGDQWDIWQAVYSPVGPDGYPMPIWDKITGEIDHEVAEYWRENYDLNYIIQRDWETLGPLLEGKLFIYVGDMDNYYLDRAVRLTEEFLESSANPYYGGEVDYGDGDEHCWNGDHTRPNATSRLRYHQMFIPRIMDQIRRNHPVGVDTLSWRY